MDAGIHCSKEMVDLLMRVKKHLKLHHQVALNMSDSHVMERLLELATVKDDVLQGMMQYLMALAGGDWSARYLNAAGKAGGTAYNRKPVESLSSKLKNRLLSDTTFSGAVTTQVAPSSAPAEGGARVRYYRGQPVYS